MIPLPFSRSNVQIIISEYECPSGMQCFVVLCHTLRTMLMCATYGTFAIHHSELFLYNLCIWVSAIKIRYRQLHRLGYCVLIWSISALFLVPTRHECWSSSLSDHNRFTLAYHIIWTIKHINFPPQYY